MSGFANALAINPSTSLQIAREKAQTLRDARTGGVDPVQAKKAVIHKQKLQLAKAVRATVEHPFRVIKRQFGLVKVRYRGLEKNTAQLTTLFALSNL